MITKEIILVVAHEELTMKDLRDFLDDCDSADDSVLVSFEDRLYDGHPSTVVGAKWEMGG